MPQMGGYELLAAFRSDKALCEVPVLLLSARAGEEARISAAQAGTDDYLEKPFSGRELLAKIDALLLKARMRSIEGAQAKRMATVFEQAPAAIALLRGPAHVFELANPSYRALIGGRDVLGQPVRQALPELAGQGIFELLDQVYRCGDPYVGHALRLDVMRGTPPALHECYFDFVYQPMRAASGEVEGIAIVVFEVTEAVRVKRLAEAANRAKDEFMAMLGHELRNPLAPIMTALELMKLHGVKVAEKERGIIERQAQHLIGLVNDLLDVARVAQDKVKLCREPVELSEVIRGAVETASPLLEQRQHLLQIDVPRQGLLLHADKDRLCQVFANLLTNAAKYSDNGSRIVVGGHREGAEIVVDVIDNGHGIDADLLPQIFELFCQDPQSLARSKGGLGLGLTIVRSLTELHGGSVRAYSEGRGLGARFNVRLPALEPGGAGVPAPCAGAGALEPMQPAARQGAAILVVDDNADAAATLKDLLQSLGYEVRTAADGPSALKSLAERMPDMAILDIGLPGMDGYELATRIRALQGGDAILLIALTGYGQDSDRRHALAAGFDRHLTKPLSRPALRGILDDLRLQREVAPTRGA
jgi:signal transduction histidine kinase/DNA-binding response OmpR family regulator